jgi:hypothetical protein
MTDEAQTPPDQTNVVPMPAEKLKPGHVLRGLLDQSDKIDSVMCMVVYKDGTVDTVGSKTNLSKLSMMSLMLQRRAIREMDAAVARSKAKK